MGNLPRRTGATAHGQVVKVKVSGRAGPALLACVSGGSRRPHRRRRPYLASLASISPRLSGALPGSTSTDQLGVATTMAALCPLKRRRLLVPVAQLRVHQEASGPCSPHRSHPVISSISIAIAALALMSWSSNCPSNSAPATMLAAGPLSSGNPRLVPAAGPHRPLSPPKASAALCGPTSQSSPRP